MTQEEFDVQFITSTEVCAYLDVNRYTVFNNIKNGRLPAPIIIRRANGGTHIALWNRQDVSDILVKWKTQMLLEVA